MKIEISSYPNIDFSRHTIYGTAHVILWHVPCQKELVCLEKSNTLNDVKMATKETRHRASTSMYSLTFRVRVMSPERHQWKPAVQTATVMLRTPPSAAGRPRPLPICGARFWGRPPSPAGRRPSTRADPAQPAVRTMSSYRAMDASL